MKFWSSVDLTGNQTLDGRLELFLLFWSSVDLTGNQTASGDGRERVRFWSSVDLTGNQTHLRFKPAPASFGAVSI